MLQDGSEISVKNIDGITLKNILVIFWSLSHKHELLFFLKTWCLKKNNNIIYENLHTGDRGPREVADLSPRKSWDAFALEAVTWYLKPFPPQPNQLLVPSSFETNPSAFLFLSLSPSSSSSCGAIRTAGNPLGHFLSHSRWRRDIERRVEHPSCEWAKKK